jgi:hypothetical protein
MSEDHEEAHRNEFSLLRPELDLVNEGAEDCDGKLHISNVTHECSRPPGHSGQHYSFHGGKEEQYEVIWPILPPEE